MRMGRWSGWEAAVLAVVAGWTMPAAAQETGPGRETIALFFDCQGSGCYDDDFFRREIPYVNWVRDRESADVHVLVTSERTGGGGLETTLAFIGRRDFEGQDQSLVVHTSGDATPDEIRRAEAAKLALGLVRYLADTPVGARLRVVAGESAGPRGGPPAQGPATEDPWDYWVFRVSANGFLNGESSYSFRNVSTGLSANRITDAWKLAFRGSFTRRTQSYELSDSTLVSRWEDWSAAGLVVKSITAHTSVGARAGMGRSTSLNEDFRWVAAAGMELNLFPYAESSRRSLTVQALMNVRHWDYHEETIFLETSETRVAASLTSTLTLNQPWGQTGITFDHARYLHDTRKYHVSLGGDLEVRLFKGFSVNLYGEYEWIRDQLYLSAQNATDEEILVQQRQLQTSFQYYTSFGISYRFGSIFNNVVNPRFGPGDRGVYF